MVSRSPTELPNKLFLLSMASYFTLLLIHRFSKSTKVVFKAALPGGSTYLLKMGWAVGRTAGFINDWHFINGTCFILIPGALPQVPDF